MWSVVIVLYLNQRAALDFLGYLCVFGEGLNIGASDNLYTFAFGCRRNDEVIVYHEMLRHGNQRGFSQCMGICHNACQRGCNGCFGADDINLCGFCPASAFKVSVDGTQGNRIRCRSLSHADAGAAATSRIRAPAEIISASAPFAASIFITCLEPGAITRLTSG